MRFYLIGIKGSGMSALALYLQDLGHLVEGSDDDTYYFTEDELKKRNIPIYSFNENNIDGKSVYIISHAHEKNTETKKIIENEYHYYFYHQFIGNISFKNMIAIAGTHGKTTTCKLLAHLLKEEDVSYIIGSGEGYGSLHTKDLIVEACEYKEHFLKFKPKVLIINNIEMDHPDYYKNIKMIISAFQKVANQSEMVIANGDDENVRKIRHSNIYYFGFGNNNDIKTEILKTSENGYKISITANKEKREYQLPFTGKHMIYNFLASFTEVFLNHQEESIKQIDIKLKNFEFPKRRLNQFKYHELIFIDDYAHHPTEIKALYDSIKQLYPSHKIAVLFQPHTYTRTLKLKKEFIEVLSLFDDIYIHPTFTSKREKQNKILDKKVKRIFKNFKIFTPNLIEIIKENIRQNSYKKIIWIFLGAGTMDQYWNEIKNLIDKNIFD